MSLIEEFCKTVSGDIFGAIVSWLKWMVNILKSDHFYYIPITYMAKCFNIDVKMFLTMRMMKNSRLKFKQRKSMFLEAVVVGMLQGFLLFVSKLNKIQYGTLIMTWK